MATLDVDLLEGKKVKKRMSDGVLPYIKIEFQSLSSVRDLESSSFMPNLQDDSLFAGGMY